MKKKQLRVVAFDIGFITLYKSQVKTWLGWQNFNAYEWGDIYYSEMIRPTTHKYKIYNNIDLYRKIKGLTKEEIEVTKITK